MTPERMVTEEMVEIGLAKLEISLSDEAREKLRSMLCPKCGGADGGGACCLYEGTAEAYQRNVAAGEAVTAVELEMARQRKLDFDEREFIRTQT